MKNKIKLFILAFIGLSLLINTKALEESIQLDSSKTSKSYVGELSIPYTMSKDGKYYFYTLGNSKVGNMTVKRLEESQSIDGGIQYILLNGYPTKTITNDKDKDYYITQTAIWWYMDMTKGKNNLSEAFKTTASDTYNLRKTIQDLVNNAYSHRNDSITPEETRFTLGIEGNNQMSLDGNYYISNTIKAATNKNVKEYTITLVDAPTGTKIVLSPEKEMVYKNSFTLSGNDSFKIKVPLTDSLKTDLSIRVQSFVSGYEKEVVQEYKSINNNDSNHVICLLKESEKLASETSVKISSSKVMVRALDRATKQTISGAQLVLKDANGSVISSWTSTINTHIFRNLKNGTYSIEEIKEPNGYLKNEEVIKFTISNTNKEIKIDVLHDTQKVVVNITKVDQETNELLPGAILSVKRSDGTEIAYFTTTENAHILMDLMEGTYFVEEISAPEGYRKSNEKIYFTIDSTHQTHQIVMKNAKEIYVPNTSSTFSYIISILGIIIIGTGLGFINKYGKKVK